jgi:hypothetical protein
MACQSSGDIILRSRWGHRLILLFRFLYIYMRDIGVFIAFFSVSEWIGVWVCAFCLFSDFSLHRYSSSRHYRFLMRLREPTRDNYPSSLTLSVLSPFVFSQHVDIASSAISPAHLLIPLHDCTLLGPAHSFLWTRIRLFLLCLFYHHLPGPSFLCFFLASTSPLILAHSKRAGGSIYVELPSGSALCWALMSVTVRSGQTVSF